MSAFSVSAVSNRKELIDRDLDIDVLEIMLPRPFDDEQVVYLGRDMHEAWTIVGV